MSAARGAAIVGTLLSVAGIAVISGISGRDSVPLLSLLAVLAAVLCFAEATVLVRRFPPVHPVTTNNGSARLDNIITAMPGMPKNCPR